MRNATNWPCKLFRQRRICTHYGRQHQRKPECLRCDPHANDLSLGRRPAACRYQREPCATDLFRAAGWTSRFAAPVNHQQHGWRSNEQHRISNHRAVFVQFFVELKHLRLNAEQRRQLHGPSRLHTVCARCARGHTRGDFLDPWRHSSPGASWWYRSGCLGNRPQPGPYVFYAAHPWASQCDADHIDHQHQQRFRNGPGAFCPVALQPRPEHLRLRSGGRSRLLGGSCIHADGKRSRYRHPHRQLISFRYRCRRVVDRNRWCCRFGPVAARIAQLSVDRCRQHNGASLTVTLTNNGSVSLVGLVLSTSSQVSDRVDNVRWHPLRSGPVASRRSHLLHRALGSKQGI